MSKPVLESGQATNNGDFKDVIAKIISTYVPFATGILGFAGLLLVAFFIYVGEYEEALDTLKYVFTALLPIWGTWIGTVLAYYFSKQNFEAASKSVQNLVDSISPREKLETLLARDIMIKFEDLKCDNLAKGEAVDDLTIVSIRQKIIDAGIKRWPIFQEKVYKYIFHKSTLDDYLTDKLLKDKLPEAELNALNIAKMKSDNIPWIQRVIKDAAVFIPETASLYDAKKEMDKHEACNDAFVTKTGNKDEEVLGWISNVDIAKHGKF